MSATVDIKEADLHNIEACASIALLGKRRTGKTTWAKYILQFISKDIDRFVALCGNKDNACEWKRLIQPLFVMPKSIPFLKKLRDYQDERVSQYSTNQLPIPKKYRICIILDDCGSDRTFMHSPIIKDILSNGRHYGMTVLILCQYLNQMHAENRDQLDYLCMLYTSNQRNIKKIHEEYVNICDLRTFKYVLNACTDKKGMCWIDNTKNPSVIEQCVFFKKMIWPYEFHKVGAPSIRKYGHSHYLDCKEKTNEEETIKCDSSNKYQKDSFMVDGVDTDSDEGNDWMMDNIPEHILANKCVYTDKRGSIIIRKEVTKEKIE